MAMHFSFIFHFSNEKENNSNDRKYNSRLHNLLDKFKAFHSFIHVLQFKCVLFGYF